MPETPEESGSAVEDFIASIDDEQTVNDCRVLVDLMARVSGHTPRIWNVGTIGFGSYHFRYDSGREGDCQTIASIRERARRPSI